MAFGEEDNKMLVRAGRGEESFMVLIHSKYNWPHYNP